MRETYVHVELHFQPEMWRFETNSVPARPVTAPRERERARFELNLMQNVWLDAGCWTNKADCVQLNSWNRATVVERERETR